MYRLSRYRRPRGGWKMLRPSRGWLRVGGGALTAHLIMAATVWAQKPGRIPDDDSGWLQWGIAVAIAIIVCVTAFINPKRSHLT